MYQDASKHNRITIAVAFIDFMLGNFVCFFLSKSVINIEHSFNTEMFHIKYVKKPAKVHRELTQSVSILARVRV